MLETNNVLIGCEISGKIRNAYKKKGINAISCDLLPSDDNAAGHIVGDIVDVIKSRVWDLVIMHPPCTALAVSGNRWYGRNCPKHSERLEAIDWTVKLWELAKKQSKRVCMENPVGVLPIKPTQYIQPWQFGHGETKKTGLWLYNLPKLKPTQIVDGREQRIFRMPPSADRGKLRSETFQGIADAIADQWFFCEREK